MKKHTQIILTILFSIALYSCKVDIDTSTKLNDVEFLIKTDEDSLVKNACVFIYDNRLSYLLDYKHQIKDTNNSAATIKGYANEGIFNAKLDPKQKYWIRVVGDISVQNFKNKDIIGNSIIPYSNDELVNTFGPFDSANPLDENMTTKATIKLTKAYNLLVVCAHEHSKVKVFDSNNQLYQNPLNPGDSILSYTSKSTIDTNTVLDKNSNGYKVFLIKKGKNKVVISSANGCTFLDSVTATGRGHIYTVEAPVCNAGTIVFYNSNSTFRDIKIILTPNDTLGTLTTNDNTINSGNACGLKNSTALIKVGRPAGSYTFYAVPNGGSKIVTKSFTISAGECKTFDINP